MFKSSSNFKFHKESSSTDYHTNKLYTLKKQPELYFKNIELKCALFELN